MPLMKASGLTFQKHIAEFLVRVTPYAANAYTLRPAP